MYPNFFKIVLQDKNPAIDDFIKLNPLYHMIYSPIYQTLSGYVIKSTLYNHDNTWHVLTTATQISMALISTPIFLHTKKR